MVPGLDLDDDDVQHGTAMRMARGRARLRPGVAVGGDRRCDGGRHVRVKDELDIPVVLGLREDDHGVLRDEGNALVSSETSPVPWRDDDRWQESCVLQRARSRMKTLFGCTKNSSVSILVRAKKRGGEEAKRWRRGLTVVAGLKKIRWQEARLR